MNHRHALEHLIRSFENLSPDTVGMLADLYSPDAYFKDPFNEVRGHAAIVAIFEHMFRQVEKPRFRIGHSFLEGSDAFIAWEFHCRAKSREGSELCIHGSSHLRFGFEHKVTYHRDYWDAAEELYEKLPGLGWLMRLIKRRVQHRERVS